MLGKSVSKEELLERIEKDEQIIKELEEKLNKLQQLLIESGWTISALREGERRQLDEDRYNN